MSEEQPAKKARTGEKYLLFYWPGIPGRGEPTRLALEEAAADYEDVAYTRGVKAVTALLGAGDGGGGHFAPPILQHGTLSLSQTPNIMQYLGPRLGLVPDDEAGRLKVNQLYLTISDLQNEAHDTHHPVAVSEYYESQKDVALKRAADFRTTRIPKYFKHIEAVLTRTNTMGAGAAKDEDTAGGWLVGDSLTYADLMLYHLVEGLKHAFPRALARIEKSETYPRIFALYERVKARPRIKAYLASDRRPKFGNGLYRHYDELDDPEEGVERATTEQAEEEV